MKKILALVAFSFSINCAPAASEDVLRAFHRPRTEAEKTLDTILARNMDEKNWDIYGFVFNYPDSREKQQDSLNHFFTKKFLDKAEQEEKALIISSCGGQYPEDGRPCDMIRSSDPIACAQDKPGVYLYRTIESGRDNALITYTWSGQGDGPTYSMIKEGKQWKLDATSCETYLP